MLSSVAQKADFEVSTKLYFTDVEYPVIIELITNADNHHNNTCSSTEASEFTVRGLNQGHYLYNEVQGHTDKIHKT